MSDFTQEIRLSKEILARASEAYRKIRNTLRYLLANLHDFDPTTDRVPIDRLEEIDRYVLGRYAELGLRVSKAYTGYDYATVFQGLNAFTTVDLSALYVDVSKDRLYTFATRSRQRRSAQTAMYIMVDGLARLMAPILPFTADELWRYLPAAREESVHIATFPSDAEFAALIDQQLLDRWTTLLSVREAVLAEIEPFRKTKQIGSSLQASVAIAAAPETLALLERYAHELPMLFIVSDVELKPISFDGSPLEEGRPQVLIGRAGGSKCERCWRYVPAVAAEPEWAGLCPRCKHALAESGQPS